MFLNQLIIYF